MDDIKNMLTWYVWPAVFASLAVCAMLFLAANPPDPRDQWADDPRVDRAEVVSRWSK